MVWGPAIVVWVPIVVTEVAEREVCALREEDAPKGMVVVVRAAPSMPKRG